MATSSNSCGICNLRHISKPSVVWCSDCNEGLCEDCREHHSLLKPTRDHNIILIAEYQKLPSFITNIAMHCNEHDEKYLLFCKKHNQLLCRKCVISETHRECKEISTFEDVVLNVKKSVAFTEIESSLQELKENITLILKDRQKNLSTISASKEKLQSEISSIRRQINCHLDEIQDHFIVELNKAVENSAQQIKNFIASLEEKQREIDTCIEDVDIIKNHATDLQTFLGTKELGIKLNEKEKDLQSWIDDGSLGDTSISYQLNTLLQNFSEETATFGKPIVEVQPCKLPLQRRKEGQAQLMKVDKEHKSFVEHITLELKAKFDTKATDVSGCCILPCGKLVVSNHSPSYLVLFAPDGKFEKRITDIMSSIHDVTCVDNDTVAVISAKERNIQLVSLKSGKVFRSINTNFCSVGITYKKGKFIVCPDQDHMREVRIEDSMSSTIGSTVLATYVATLGNALFSAKRNTDSIVCLNRNGDRYTLDIYKQIGSFSAQRYYSR